MSQTLHKNSKEPIELGNLNACTEVKLCLYFIYSGSKNSLLQD